MLRSARRARLEARGADQGRKLVDGAWVYILGCSDGSYYTGLTRRSPEERLAEHQAGLVEGYTYRRRPVTLLHAEHFSRLTDAMAAERQVKGWSRAKKEALIARRYDLLPGLSSRSGRESKG